MAFRQEELISTGYLMYTFSIMVVLLLIVYLALKYFKVKLLQNTNSKSITDLSLRKIRLSTKTMVYIIDHGLHDIVIVESASQISVLKVKKCDLDDVE